MNLGREKFFLLLLSMFCCHFCCPCRHFGWCGRMIFNNDKFIVKNHIETFPNRYTSYKKLINEWPNDEVASVGNWTGCNRIPIQSSFFSSTWYFPEVCRNDCSLNFMFLWQVAETMLCLWLGMRATEVVSFREKNIS